MVSSKCCQVESPSPFRFLAALMPPCAHTEWDRFTGTTEKRSASPPISAILMTAARPASPPPTTMIFGAAILKSPIAPLQSPRRAQTLPHHNIGRTCIRVQRLNWRPKEAIHADAAEQDQSEGENGADIP